MSVAKLWLNDFLKEENYRAEANQATVLGKMLFGDILLIYQQQLQDAQHPVRQNRSRQVHPGVAENLAGT